MRHVPNITFPSSTLASVEEKRCALFRGTVEQKRALGSDKPAASGRAGGVGGCALPHPRTL